MLHCCWGPGYVGDEPRRYSGPYSGVRRDAGRRGRAPRPTFWRARLLLGRTRPPSTVRLAGRLALQDTLTPNLSMGKREIPRGPGPRPARMSYAARLLSVPISFWAFKIWLETSSRISLSSW